MKKKHILRMERAFLVKITLDSLLNNGNTEIIRCIYLSQYKVLFGRFVMVFALLSYTFEADNQGNYSYLVIVVTMCFTHCFGDNINYNIENPLFSNSLKSKQ